MALAIATPHAGLHNDGTPPKNGAHQLWCNPPQMGHTNCVRETQSRTPAAHGGSVCAAKVVPAGFYATDPALGKALKNPYEFRPLLQRTAALETSQQQFVWGWPIFCTGH
jgi:hypothetical protein